jgi:hypothetical protein
MFWQEICLVILSRIDFSGHNPHAKVNPFTPFGCFRALKYFIQGEIIQTREIVSTELELIVHGPITMQARQQQ